MAAPASIRPATEADIDRLQDIERAAGQVFRAVGMAAIADDDPPPRDLLRHVALDGRAWVAVDDTDRPVAYLMAEWVDGAVHIEQVSVHPDAARRGIGRALIEHLAAWGAARGAHALTLTTFIEPPWNAPYYEHCGFRLLDESALSPGLRAIRQREAVLGLDRWPRCAMRRDL